MLSLVRKIKRLHKLFLQISNLIPVLLSVKVETLTATKLTDNSLYLALFFSISSSISFIHLDQNDASEFVKCAREWWQVSREEQNAPFYRVDFIPFLFLEILSSDPVRLVLLDLAGLANANESHFSR